MKLVVNTFSQTLLLVPNDDAFRGSSVVAVWLKAEPD